MSKNTSERLSDNLYKFLGTMLHDPDARMEL